MPHERYFTDFWISDERALAEARRFNQLLFWVPRFRLPNRFTPLLLQSLLCLSQIGGSQKLKSRGFKVERRVVSAGGGHVSVRIIRPAGLINGVVLDIHGGGWVFGNAQMDDKYNAAMAEACNVAVVSVDYQLAGRIPIARLIEDCLVAARWLLSDGAPEYSGLPVIFVGESAGAHLVAATLLQLKTWPNLLRRVKGTVLYYGVYDLTGTPSVHEAGPDTLVLHGPSLTAAFRLLTPDLSDAERQQAPLSPLCGDLHGLPPALMFVGELDPLLDDTVKMAYRWQLNANANIETYIVPEAPHGFIHLPTRIADQILKYSYGWIRTRIGIST